MVVMAMTQEKARDLLTGLTQTADRRQTGAHEIADRLMGRIRDPDRRISRNQDLCCADSIVILQRKSPSELGDEGL